MYLKKTGFEASRKEGKHKKDISVVRRRREGARAQVLFMYVCSATTTTTTILLRTVYSASSEVEDAAVARPWKILTIRRSNFGHCGFPHIIREYIYIFHIEKNRVIGQHCVK